MEVLNDSIIWFNSWSGGFSEYNVNSGNVIVYMQRKFPGLRKNIPVLAIIPSFIKLSNDYFLLGGQTRVTGLFEIKSKTNHPLNITGIENAIDVVMFLAEDKKGNIWLLRNGMLYTSIPEYSRLKTFDISKQFTTNKNANNETPNQSGRLKAPAIATPSKVPCAMVSAKKDMCRHSIKQPKGAVRKTKSVPMVHAGNNNCNHSIMA